MKLIIFALCIALVTGCASSYQRMDFFGGYTDQQVGEREWIITAAGNAFTNAGKTSDFAMLRAAELGQELGFPYFVINDMDNFYRVVHTDSGATFQATTKCHGPSCDTRGHIRSGQSTIAKPRSGLRVLYLHESEVASFSAQDRSRVLTVADIYQRLAPIYIDD